MPNLLMVGNSSALLSDLGRLLQRDAAGLQVLHSTDAQAALDLLSVRDVELILVHLEESPAAHEMVFSALAQCAPDAVRVALFDSTRQVPEYITHAHQVVAVQGDASALLPVVNDALAMLERARKHPGLLRLMGRLQRVPSPPVMYFELRDQVARAGADMAAIAQVSARDPALVARILRVANSGLYALPRSINDVSQALGLIGTDALLGLVLATHVYSGLPPPGIRLEALWQHALKVSELAKALARNEGATATEMGHCGVAGLLHDLGALVLMENEAVRYQPIWRQAAGRESELLRLEQETFAVTHPQIGAMLLAMWGLPEPIVDAVQASHGLVDSRLLSCSVPIRAVGLAEQLVDAPQAVQQAGEQAGIPDILRNQWREARDAVLSGHGVSR